MRTALFLASTPLHTFWSLGLAHGVFRDWRCVLAMIDQRPSDHDFIAEALGETVTSPFQRIEHFPQIGKSPAAKLRRARVILRAVSALSAELRPAYITVGNDRRAEFYAALQASPGATGAYVDDGMYSYMPMPRQSRIPGVTGLSAWVRRGVYGLPVEQPRYVGGSRAAADAWVLLPGSVHTGLASKNVREIEADWFRQAPVQAVCTRALALAGVDAEAIRRIRLLLVLPHDAFLREQPDLRARIEQLAQAAHQRGEAIAFKRHPRSSASTPVLPEGDALEIPRRLPVEILAPLLSDALVVGTQTTALLSLKRLAANTRVATFPQPGQAKTEATRIYRAVGILPLE